MKLFFKGFLKERIWREKNSSQEKNLEHYSFIKEWVQFLIWFLFSGMRDILLSEIPLSSKKNSKLKTFWIWNKIGRIQILFFNFTLKEEILKQRKEIFASEETWESCFLKFLFIFSRKRASCEIFFSKEIFDFHWSVEPQCNQQIEWRRNGGFCNPQTPKPEGMIQKVLYEADNFSIFEVETYLTQWNKRRKVVRTEHQNCRK